MLNVMPVRTILISLLATVILTTIVHAQAKPTTPGQTISIADFGAVADGKTLNTTAIQSAIEAAAAAGGGRVRIPSGTYLTGPITLRTGVDLHAEAGAIVLFSRNYDDYPVVSINYEGKDTAMCQSPISADGAHDISITGPGIFDGQGDVWRPLKKSKVTDAQWNDIVKSGGRVDDSGQNWYPTRAGATQIPNDPRNDPYKVRPTLLYLSNCQNVLLEGATFRNSPNWNLHLLLSDDITIRNVTLYNPLYAQNGDGCDMDSCRNVLLTDSTVDAGDDCVCLKSGRDEAGRLRNRPTENITISNCHMGTGHGGVVIGSEMSGGVRNVTVSNCVFTGTDAGLRFKSALGRGGTVENIDISDVEMSDIHGAAILFDMNYSVGIPRGTTPTGPPPAFRDFRIRNITCTGAKQAIVMRGLAQLPLEDVTMQNIRITADTGAIITNSRDITLEDVNIQATTGPAMTTENVQGLSMQRVSTSVTSPGTSRAPARQAPAAEPQ